eukprot:5547535-Prymnesium_polylepis.1
MAATAFFARASAAFESLFSWLGGLEHLEHYSESGFRRVLVGGSILRAPSRALHGLGRGEL